MKDLYLASQSPRRKELLQQLGFSFKTVSVDCDEVFPKTMPTAEVAGYLSKLKAEAYPELKNNEVLLTADTIVAVEDTILGKPASEAEAKTMLQQLSNRTHKVYTGVSFRTVDGIITLTDSAEVSFDELKDEEIAFYIKTCAPLDKAGAYGIQDWLGMSKIKQIQGSFYTIMGLPTHLVYRTLSELMGHAK